jgi:uncharacterized protein (DUF1501 family)
MNMPPKTPQDCGDCSHNAFSAMSRRSILKALGVGVAGSLAPVMLGEGAFVSASFASGLAPGDDSVLVVISLRGGIDGLSVVVPYADPLYQQRRPNIAVPTSRLLVPNAQFGLHPALEPLLPLWNSGKVAAIQAVGLPFANKSHFEAAAYLEDARSQADADFNNGWINRTIGAGAVASGSGSALGEWANETSFSDALPHSMRGPNRATAGISLTDLQLRGTSPGDFDGAAIQRRINQWNTLWGSAPAGSTQMLSVAAQSVVDISNTFAAAIDPATEPVSNPGYAPGDKIGRGLGAIARSLRGGLPIKVAAVENTGWDLHKELGVRGDGTMSNHLGPVAQSIAAFFSDLGPTLSQRVTVVTLSEFGRRIDENDSSGLDHGWGNMMLVAGAGVKGGYYAKDWPGLADDDLQVVTDYRSVLTEILEKRSPDVLTTSTPIFPGVTMNRQGFML